MKKEKHKPSPKKKEIVPVIEKKLVVRLAFIIALTLHHGYVLDDASIIKDNTMTKGGTSSLKDIFTSSYRAGQANAENDLYRPMSKALFAIEWEIAPDNSTLAHFINIVLYGIACVLMFLVFSRWTRINIYILFITTLLFAAHPIHTEVVANIKSADEILEDASSDSFSCLFFLCVIIQRIRHRFCGHHSALHLFLYGIPC
ncbi:MAG: bacteriophage receptor-2C outer rane subunit [Bacteroidetes bacterium]|nr:bacteriophage receptor-2C outer rane subunit [Bacteroidota bacterium]